MLLSSITDEQIIRVPFLDKGRDLSGWDCVGCARWLSKNEMGIETDPFLDGYSTTDIEHKGDLQRAIHRELGKFIQIDKPRKGCWILISRFDVDCHIAWAVDDRWMIHADAAGEGKGRVFRVRAGGTYIEDYTQAPWNKPKRITGFFEPRVK